MLDVQVNINNSQVFGATSVTTYYDGSVMSLSKCGALYFLDIDGQYKRRSLTGGFTISSLKTVNQAYFNMLLNEIGTEKASLIIDVNIPITSGKTTINNNITYRKLPGCSFVVSGTGLIDDFSNPGASLGLDYVPNSDWRNPVSFSANLYQFSELFTNANNWIIDNCSVSAVSSPKGDLTAFSFIPNTTNTSHRLRRFTGKRASVIAGVEYFESISVRPTAGTGYTRIAYETNTTNGGVSRIVVFDFVNNTLISDPSLGKVKLKSVPIENGYYRVTANFTSETTGTNTMGWYIVNTTSINFAGDGVKGLDMFGAQISQGLKRYLSTSEGIPVFEMGENDWESVPGTLLTSDLGYNSVLKPGIGGYYYRKKFKDYRVYASDFGIIGDNVTECGTLLQQALDFCLSTGRLLVLPQGSIKSSIKLSVNIASAAAGFGIIGQGKTNNTFANLGGTQIFYTGPSGSGTAAFEITGTSPYRFFRFSDFTIQGQYNDAAEVGFKWATSQSSAFIFTNFDVKGFTTAVELNNGTGSNAEFNRFQNCVFNGTMYGYTHNAQQALAPLFLGGSVGVIGGGTVWNLKNAAGGKIIGVNSSNGLEPWAANKSYSIGSYVTNAGNTYRVITAGTSSASTPPTGTGSSITDNSVVWEWKRATQGTTFVSVTGNQADTISFDGGRNEGINIQLASVSSGGQIVSFRDMVFTIAKPVDSTVYFNGIKCDGTRTSVFMENVYTYISDANVKNLEKYEVILQPSSGLYGSEVYMKNCTFGGLHVMLSKYVFDPSLAPSKATTQSNINNRVVLENVTETFNFSTPLKKMVRNVVLVDNTEKYNLAKRQENLLLYSKFGTVASNLTPVGWIARGSSSFASKSDLDSVSINSGSVTSSGIRIGLSASSGVHQDITSLDITTAFGNFIFFKALIQPQSAGEIRFAFVNSVDETIVYDQHSFIIPTGSAGNYLRKQEINLEAFISRSQTGSVRLIIENLSTGILTFDLFYQHAYRFYDAYPVYTEGIAISKAANFDQIYESVKFSQRLQLPYKPNGFENMPDLEADVYINNSSLTERIYTDRWEERPRQDIGTATPTTGTWPKGFIRWNSAFDGTTPVYWECVTAGSPGTWFAIYSASDAVKEKVINVTAPSATPLTRTITMADFGNGATITVWADATNAAITVVFPAAASLVGYTINIIKMDASANSVTAKANGSELINTANTDVIGTANAARTYKSNGTRLGIF